MRKRLAKAFFNISEDDFASQRTFYHTMELLVVGVIALAIGPHPRGSVAGLHGLDGRINA